MFEAVVLLCLAGREEMCRQVMLPGHEAATPSACEARLAEVPPVLPGDPRGLVVAGGPECVAAGHALDFVEVAQGVFVHRGAIAEPDRDNRGDVANIAFVIGERAVAVIDSGSARWIGEAAWRAVRERTALPVSHVILTHMHPDHIFGAGVFAATGAAVVGHEGLARAISDRRANYLESLEALIGPAPLIGTDAAAVDVAVADPLMIDLGGRILDLTAWPPAHTGTDLTVLDRGAGVLFAGDLVFDIHVPALDGSVTGWQAVLPAIGEGAVQVVPGHGGPVLPWPEGGVATARYLAVLADDTRDALDRGLRLGDAVEGIAGTEVGHWQLFDAFNRRNATVAFTELEWE